MYLVPSNIRESYYGDEVLWNGYELIETAMVEGFAAHQASIQNRLNEFRFMPETIQMLDIRTAEYRSDAPAPQNVYLSTLWFTVIGTPDTYPLTP